MGLINHNEIPFGLAKFVLFFHPPLHQLAGVQDGAVIASAERFADFV